ncbi:GGDEF domain-containing protein [Fervidobacterium thailandense]|uniref:GGDEF domain-containing protein n=1 Tax=Fervidobacterium thailandense TaxID=1008305 RepID=A0A1E3G3B3_9BACT|nr:GGDEF domain-containing protein [Fervidobacterium thailandense]ODN30727.1 hypothetical protein A4H02_04150 [Fervidobacterium thailandense]
MMRAFFEGIAIFMHEDGQLVPLAGIEQPEWAQQVPRLAFEDPKFAHLLLNLPVERVYYTEVVLNYLDEFILLSVLGVVLPNKEKLIIVLRHSDVVAELSNIISAQTDMIRQNAKEIAELREQQSLLAEQLAEIVKQLAVMNRMLIRKNREIEEMALHDPLTGAYNRRYLDDYLKAEIAKARRYGSVFSVVFCDLDNFKKLNDTYGHAYGDFILKRFVNIMEGSLREGEDKIIRYGGDEFVVILSQADTFKAQKVMQRILKKCQGEGISFSFGILSSEEFKDHLKPEDIIDAIDKKMYEHKRLKGRNAELFEQKDDKE